MDFIRDLHEARFTRNPNNVKSLTFNDCRERVYLILLCLEMMRHSAKFSLTVKKYANQTRGFEDFRLFRLNGTDFYNYMYFIFSKDGYQKLRDPESALKIKEETKVPRVELNQYLVSLAKGEAPKLPTRLFMKIEAGLQITNPDYKSIRRQLSDWEDLKLHSKKIVATKLLYAVRAKLRSSDIIDDFETWVVANDAESHYTPDTEPVISVPDIATGTDQIVLYRYLAGSENLAMLKQFIEHAKDGRSISAPMVKAYQPIIQLIDDIVQGGPGMIQQLKVLRSRAKKRNK